MNREKKIRMLKETKINQIIGFFMTFLVVFSSLFLIQANAAEENLQYTIRHEVIQSNGVLVSQPKRIDKTIDFILKTNRISTLEDYSKWLKANIEYTPDNRDDIWTDPAETLKRRQGDCEDFAFLTAEVLKGLGYQPRFLALVREGEAHAICVFKKDGYYMWFDNTTLKSTTAKTLKDFAKEVTSKYNFLQLSELNTHDHSWKTLYRKS